MTATMTIGADDVSGGSGWGATEREEATPRRAAGFAALNATNVCVDAIDARRFRRVALRADDPCETISGDDKRRPYLLGLGRG